MPTAGGGAHGAGMARLRELRAASSADLRRCQSISWLVPENARPKTWQRKRRRGGMISQFFVLSQRGDHIVFHDCKIWISSRPRLIWVDFFFSYSLRS
jgi:hypothetical protein